MARLQLFFFFLPFLLLFVVFPFCFRSTRCVAAVTLRTTAKRERKKKKKETGKKSGRRHRSGTYARVLLYRVLLFFFFSVFWLVCKLAYAHRNFV